MIKIEKAKLNQEIVEHLKKALGDDLDDILHEIEAETCELWAIDEAGYTVTRLEQSKTSSELVLVAGVSTKNSGANYSETVSAFCTIAKKLGINSVRAHTTKKGIKKQLEKLGFYELETAYRVRLDGR